MACNDAAGRRTEFTIITKDLYAVPLQAGGLLITGTIEGNGNQHEVTFVDSNDGTYTGRYEIPNGESGNYDLRVVVENIDGPIDVLKSTVKVVAVGTGMLSLAMSSVVGSGLVLAQVGVDTGFVVYLRDATGAPYVQNNVSIDALVSLSPEIVLCSFSNLLFEPNNNVFPSIGFWTWHHGRERGEEDRQSRRLVQLHVFGATARRVHVARWRLRSRIPIVTVQSDFSQSRYTTLAYRFDC